ncbi:2,3-diketo-5-methylthio-1-phosphopentane phosphatase [Dendryphion nanum]|uniref:2,3-diketo-5-methylthio-1-phosphopentane phosphatase n=1 Tax=Dendryphion nanum TaxID=256645 RepID=A0A9P9D791_9PLEO|nr:2,3-diketo-5-methylthio-1-phosphopentane phosphatase [Dendryphion nanum]
MAPIAITPPAVEVKSFSSSQPAQSIPADTSRIGTKRKIICFSDFDGTIFMQDTGHILFNSFGCGSERRQVLDQQIHTGERSFREVSEEMWGSLDVPFEDGFEVMKEALDIDVDFQTFHKFCINNDIPFNVISAGLKPVLRKVLDHFLGEEESQHIDIVANDATISSDGSEWKPVWLHDTELGHDKAKSINDYKDGARLESDDGTIPLIVFIGDGVSDLPAAREADVLFARRGLRLEEYCIENSLPYIAFDTFADIQREVTRIAKVDDEKTKGQGLPATFNPRANMWRRASSKRSVPVFAAMTPRKEEKMFIWPEAFSQLKTPLEGAPLEALETAPVAAPAA